MQSTDFLDWSKAGYGPDRGLSCDSGRLVGNPEVKEEHRFMGDEMIYRLVITLRRLSRNGILGDRSAIWRGRQG